MFDLDVHYLGYLFADMDHDSIIHIDRRKDEQSQWVPLIITLALVIPKKVEGASITKHSGCAPRARFPYTTLEFN
jgi:hypothetical protein